MKKIEGARRKALWSLGVGYVRGENRVDERNSFHREDSLWRSQSLDAINAREAEFSTFSNCRKLLALVRPRLISRLCCFVYDRASCRAHTATRYTSWTRMKREREGGKGRKGRKDESEVNETRG